MSKSIVFWLSVLFVFSGAAVVWSAWKLSQSMNSTVATQSKSVQAPPPPGSDAPILKEFTLTDQTGQAVCSRDLEGQVWVASFFFAECKGSCRVQNLELAGLYRKFAPEGIKFVSITCDPDNDTVETLGPYAAGFGAKADSWSFLTGDLEYIRRIGAEIFQVPVAAQTHADRFMLVDKWGKVRAHVNWHNKDELEILKTMMLELAQETEPPAEPSEPATAAPVDADDDGLIDQPKE